MSVNAPIDRTTLLTLLDQVRDPKSGQGLTTAGLVRGVILAPGRVGFMLEVARQDVALYQSVRDEAEALISSLPGVEKAQVVLTAQSGGSLPSRSRRRHLGLPRSAKVPE